MSIGAYPRYSAICVDGWRYRVFRLGSVLLNTAESRDLRYIRAQSQISPRAHFFAPFLIIIIFLEDLISSDLNLEVNNENLKQHIKKYKEKK